VKKFGMTIGINLLYIILIKTGKEGLTPLNLEDL